MASYAEPGEPSPTPLPQSFHVSDLATDKRRLLVIYIHGFCGSEESFGQFPSHVHSFLKQAVGDTYVVYSKIYPQYETRNSMNIAVENFSRWLQPHENSQTDVILVGHSLGGLLAAQAAQLVSSFTTLKGKSLLILIVERIPLFGSPATPFYNRHNVIGLSVLRS
jgi:pimeloyl-ACP methyl ester carboxylesterase